MGKTFLQQTSFASGEISPLLKGRIDRDIYLNGASLIRNAVVSPLGGIKKRSGTEYIANTTGDAAARLISFEFNAIQTYLLVFTAGEMKVYKDDALVATVTTAPIDDLTADIIQEMNFTQSADTLILVHEDLQPVRITRTSDTAWTAASISFTNIPQYAFPGGSYSGANEIQRLNAASASGGTFSLVLDGEETVGITFGTAAANATAIQAALRGLKNTSASGITVAIDTGQVFDITFAGADGNKSWPLIGVKDYTTGGGVAVTRKTAGSEGGEATWSSGKGWPKSVRFWQQRLWFGGSKSRPQTIWGSLISGFFDFYLGTGRPDQAIEITIDDDRVNAIQNMVAGRTLQVFTTGGEFFTPIGATDRAVTPETITLEKATQHGSSTVTPIASDGVTLFIDGSGRIAREYLYLDVEQSYITEDISFLAEHLMQSPVRMDKRPANETPGEYVYFVNSDGTMAVLNRRRSQSFIAWSLFTTDGEYEDIAVVGREVYVTVKRNIDGSDVRFVEKFNPDYYTDAGIKLTDTAETSWSSLDALEGEAVFVRSSEGYPLLNNTVSSGEITTERAEDGIEVGLPFTMQVRSLPPEIPQKGGLSGRMRRIVSVNMNLYKSNGFSVNTGGSASRVALASIGDIYFNQTPSKFSGWKKVNLRGYSRDPYFEITQSSPIDLELLSVTMEVTT